jgi:O-antigen ligase
MLFNKYINNPLGELSLKKSTYFTLSESAIFVYVSTMILAISDPKFNTISNYFGVLIALICYLQVGSKLKNTYFKFTLPTFSFLIFIFFSTILNLNIQEITYYFQRSLMLYFLLTLIFITIRSTGRIAPVSLGFAVGVVLTWPFALDQIGVISGNERLEFSLSGENGLNPNGYGVLLNIAILLSIYELLVRNSKINIKLKIIVYVICISTIILSSYQIIVWLGSRQNQLWLLITFIGVTLFSNVSNSKVLRFILGGCITVTLIWMLYNFYSMSLHADRILSPIYALLEGQNFSSSDNVRLNMMQKGLDLFLNKPVFGYGHDGFRFNSGYGVYSHNLYVEILVNYGVMGFICFFAFPIFVVMRCIGVMKLNQQGNNSICKWVLICFIGVFISFMFRPTQFDKPMFIFLGTLGGLIYYLHDKKKNKKFVRTVAKSSKLNEV